MNTNRRVTFAIDKVVEHKYCGKSFFEFKGGTYEPPFAVKSTKGKHSLESCEACKKDHKTIVKAITERFIEFPNCCDKHKKLNNPSGFEFDKSDFGDNFPVEFAVDEPGKLSHPRRMKVSSVNQLLGFDLSVG